MRVKVGDEIFDSLAEPIMIIFDEGEKELITQMGDQTKFCSFPEKTSQAEAEDFMKI